MDYKIVESDLLGEYPYAFQSKSIRTVEKIEEKVVNIKD
jgi:hypothetical protein